MLGTEGLEVKFIEDGVRAIAEIAFRINQRSQNIGARRLYTVIEKVTETLSFEAPDLPEDQRQISIDAAYVRDKLKAIVEDEDLAKYIL